MINTIVWLAIIGFLLWVVLTITFLAFLMIPTMKQMNKSKQVQKRIKNNKGK